MTNRTTRPYRTCEESSGPPGSASICQIIYFRPIEAATAALRELQSSLEQNTCASCVRWTVIPPEAGRLPNLRYRLNSTRLARLGTTAATLVSARG